MQLGTTVRALVAVVVLAALLSACGDGNDPALTAAGLRANTAVAQAATQTRSVFAAALVGTGADALASFPGLPPAVGPDLPSGRYQWTPDSHGWTRQAAAQDLILSWPSGSLRRHRATLTVDWSAGRPTLRVGDGADGKQVVPSQADLTLAVDGVRRGAVRVELGWHATPCGVVAQPDQLRAAGDLAGDGDLVRLAKANVSVTGADSAATIASSGSLTAASAATGATLSWSATLHGSVFRNPTTCLPTGLSIGGGQVRLSLASAGHAVALKATFSGVTRDRQGRLQSADLSHGSVSVDGAQAFTFRGKLDDANHDGIPGEHVTLTSPSGAHMDGERFLRRNAGGLLEAAGALAHLIR
ncbi:MAG TPA: hypothetical protein VKA00_07570 [Trueperaceae bacterium]|nr:hypothetical protein [Trueperaceae bacterium]